MFVCIFSFRMRWTSVNSFVRILVWEMFYFIVFYHGLVIIQTTHISTSAHTYIHEIYIVHHTSHRHEHRQHKASKSTPLLPPLPHPVFRYRRHHHHHCHCHRSHAKRRQNEDYCVCVIVCLDGRKPEHNSDKIHKMLYDCNIKMWKNRSECETVAVTLHKIT